MRCKEVVLQVSILLLGLTTVWTHTFCVEEEQKSSKETICHPLQWFVTYDVPNNSTVMFLPGSHSLNSSGGNKSLITFNNKYNLSLIGTGNLNSIVMCTGNQSGFFFTDSLYISIKNLEFHGCGASMKLTNKKNSSFYGGVYFHYSNYIILTQVHITDSKGYGLHMDNVCGTVLIEHSKFIGNKDGNVVLWFKKCSNENNINTIHVEICDTEFRDGYTKHQSATGLHLLIKEPHTQVTLTNLTLTNNKGVAGGNMAINFIDFAENTGHVTIEDTIISEGHANKTGGGILVTFDHHTGPYLGNCTSSNDNNTVLTIINTMISNNTAESGGGLVLEYHEKEGVGCTTREIEIINCTFTCNKADKGSAIQTAKHNLPMHIPHYVPQLLINLTDCLFAYNSLTSKPGQYNKEGIVESFSVDNMVMKDTTFRNNNGTALMLVNSGVQFLGSVLFEENSAQYGGAIKLYATRLKYISTMKHVLYFVITKLI